MLIVRMEEEMAQNLKDFILLMIIMEVVMKMRFQREKMTVMIILLKREMILMKMIVMLKKKMTE